MKISVGSYSFQKDINSKKITQFDTIAKAKEIGFSGIEFIEIEGETYDIQLKNAKKYIEEHISEDLSLEVVSKIFFFSSRYFARLFKEYTGKTYSDYVNDTKMEIAKDYLSNTDFSIGEIGRKIGYEDQGHFGRNFKKYTGLKPSEYRKRI